MAITTLLRLRDRGIESCGAAVLQFGTYDLSGHTPAGRLIADEYFLDAYAGAAVTGPTRTSHRSTPTRGSALGPHGRRADGILLQDNLAMAKRLSAAGVDVNLRVYPGSPHGFTGHPTRMAGAALDDTEVWLRIHA